MLSFWDKVYLIAHVIRWRLTWNRFSTNLPPPIHTPKFMSAMSAITMIPNGSTVATSGLGGNQRASVLFRAVHESFQKYGTPNNLTVISTGGQGGYGKVPGTVEEFALQGLCTRFIAGHLDTFRTIVRLAEEKKLELHCLPQGIISRLFGLQGHGECNLVSDIGIGTFIDPRCGPGSPVLSTDTQSFVTVVGDTLCYTLPKVQVAIINVPAVDKEGNLYVKNAAMIAENKEIALAAKRNGGMVIVNAGILVEPGYDRIFLDKSYVDAIVLDPATEQTGSVPHKKYWDFFTIESRTALSKGLSQVRFVNNIMRLTPHRSDIHSMIARVAIKLLWENIPTNAFVNIGTGLPEEVCRILYEIGVLDKIRLFTEAGILGGVPAPGIFFGAAVHPKEIVSSTDVFSRCCEHLSAGIFGLLQADYMGNANVSQKYPNRKQYVGPGGFIDLSTCAKVVLFVSNWMNHSKVIIRKNSVHFERHGQPKFVEQILETTFSAHEALRQHKKVFFVNEVGILELTSDGLILQSIMPGIDIEKDIHAFCPYITISDPHIMGEEAFSHKALKNIILNR